MLLLGSPAFGQGLSDTLQLKTVTSEAKRPGYNEVGKTSVSLDSTVLQAYQGRNLGELIGNETGFSLKQYGVSGSIGAAMRGSSSDHTAVMWNGVNLQSPTHGQFDFTLFPVFFTDKASIQPGSGSGAYGSGAIGGAVVLSNGTPKPGFSGKALLSKGSFNKQQYGLGVGYANDRWFSQTRVYWQKAENNFSISKFYFRDYNKYYLLNKSVKATHANFEQKGLTQQLGWKINERSSVNTVLFVLGSDRLLFNTNGRQQDKSLRSVTSFKRLGHRTELTALLGIQDEFLGYSDTVAKIKSNSRTRSYWTQAGMKHYLGANNSVYFFVNPQHIGTRVDGYISGNPAQTRTAVWGGWQSSCFGKRLSTDLSFRQQFIDDRSVFATPSIGASYVIFGGLSVRLHSSGVYHAPDFNDLYWAQGGNPDLLAENGWSNELGLSYKKTAGFIELTTFSNVTRNLIVWQPGPVYWSPKNLTKVWSKGIELNTGFNKQLGWLIASGRLSYTHTRSVQVESGTTATETLGKQLAYIPIQNGMVRLDFAAKGWSAGVNVHHYGRRFLTATNQNWLPAYQIVNLRLAKQWKIASSLPEIYASINNLTNRFYMVQEGYAMPGRNYEIGITLNIK